MQISTTPPSPSQADTYLNLFMLRVQERAKLQTSPRGETKVPKEQIRLTHVREHLHLISPGSSLGPSAPQGCLQGLGQLTHGAGALSQDRQQVSRAPQPLVPPPTTRGFS